MNKSQLLKFKIKNYRSFYDEQVIDFSTGKAPRAVTAVYGPNASGKSNIMKALGLMRWFIINSTAANIVDIPVEPFMLKEGFADRPSEFEIEFIGSGRHFIYGYAVTKNAVHREYMREYASTTKKSLSTIFDRENGELNASAAKYNFGKKLNEATRPTSLLITKARENNNEYANILFEWLENINVLFGAADETMQWSITQLRNDKKLAEDVLELMKEADLWIRGFNVEDVDIPVELINQLPFSEEVKRTMLNAPDKASAVKTLHALRDTNQKIVGEQIFDMISNESSGTQKFFSLAAPIVNTLQTGKVLLIDEFGAYLHPDMCNFIVALFKSEKNKFNAQLIINTHDTSLMSQDGPLARDDILFVEKNQVEETVISALSEKSTRLDDRFEKRYRQGLYGAKPQLGYEG